MEDRVTPDKDQIFSFGYYILGLASVMAMNYTNGKKKTINIDIQSLSEASQPFAGMKNNVGKTASFQLTGVSVVKGAYITEPSNGLK